MITLDDEKQRKLIDELARAVFTGMLKSAQVVASSPRPKIPPLAVSTAAERALGRVATAEERALIESLTTVVLEQWRPGLEGRLSVAGIVDAHRGRGGRMRP